MRFCYDIWKYQCQYNNSLLPNSFLMKLLKIKLALKRNIELNYFGFLKLIQEWILSINSIMNLK